MSTPKIQDYQEFLNSKAGRFVTPQVLVAQFVEKATSEKIQTIERLIRGEINEVYQITTEQGQNLILRISHSSGRKFLREQWAIERSAEVGVPVPEILALNTMETADGPRTFCLQKQIEGLPLDQIESSLDTQTRQAITVEGGLLLSKIHSVKTKGYGGIDNNGVGKFATIQESLTNLPSDQRLSELAQSVGLKPEDLIHATQILNSVAKDYTYTESHLLHHDYSTKHFMIKDAHINGIIDFENAKAGDPIEEFARWHYYFDYNYPLEWLLEGYPDKSRIDIPEFDKLIHAWRINFGIGVLDYYEEDKNINGINHAVKELLKDLEYFS